MSICCDCRGFRRRVNAGRGIPGRAVGGDAGAAARAGASTAWLPPEALVEVAEALDLTPAHVQSVASFYDMYHLAPVGEHVVEVCTNVSCALVGAQQVVDAFEASSASAPGETSEDGKVTLRTIECAGGCGYAPVVVIDHRYREPTAPGGRAGDRRGAEQWLSPRRWSSPAPTSAT